MKRLKAGLLGLSLLWCAGAASGDEILGPDVPPQPIPQSTAVHVPVVSVLRPVPLAVDAKHPARDQAHWDPLVNRAAYSADAKTTHPPARAQTEQAPRRLPDLLDTNGPVKPVDGNVTPAGLEPEQGPSLDEGQVLPVVPTSPAPANKHTPKGKPAEKSAPAKPLPKSPAKLTEAKPAIPAFKLADPKTATSKEDEGPVGEPEPLPPPAGKIKPEASLPEPSVNQAIRGENFGSEGPEADQETKAYVRAEYLLWQLRGASIPALITTGPPASGGVIGNLGVVPLLGPGTINDAAQSGGRVTVGWWLDACESVGIELSGFALEEGSRLFPFTSGDFPLLARPFFRLNPPAGEASQVSTRPGLATGFVAASQSSRLWGAEADVRHNLCRGCDYRVDVLGGFRYLDLQESLQIMEVLQATPGGSPFGGDQVMVADSFRAHNQFYGAQVGAEAEWSQGRWFVNARGKLGIGVNHETIDIAGNQVILAPGRAPVVTPGGLLALSSNSGHFTRNRFSVVPEAGVNVGYKVSDHMRAFIGYNFLFWNDVVRPGDQIDRALDVNRIPHFLPPQPPIAEARPAVPFKQADFWAQGLNVGLEYQF